MQPKAVTFEAPARPAHAVHVRAKFYKIDSGTEEKLDYGRIYQTLEKAGFNGTLSVVFEGKGINSCDDETVLTLAAAQLRRLTGGPSI